ncbi:MAG TPA: tetratricopeptide repeat protein [Kofleriaceae bacterium]|nr:tetratricopeptide repeat protein [Kofleriaceae bacterium]
MTGGTRCIAVALASALLASSALADPKAPSDKDRQVASDLVKKAIARSQAGDHAGAIKLYNLAFALVPNSLLLSNIGAEYQQDGMYKDALDYFCKYLQEDPSGTNAPYARSQAKILQRQLGKKKVADRDVCAAPVKDDDATDDAGRTEPGRHVEPGRPDTGRSDIGKTEPARGEPVRADTGRSEPPRGTGKSERVAKGPSQAPGSIDDPPPAARDTSSGNPALMYVGLGLALAGLGTAGVGVYDGVKAKDISDQVSRQDPTKPWPPGIRELEARGQHYEDLQIGFLIASGVLLTAGVVVYVAGRPDSSEHRSDKLAVGITPTHNGVSLFGRF